MRHSRFLFTSAAVTASRRPPDWAPAPLCLDHAGSSSSGSATPAAATPPRRQTAQDPTLPQLQAAAATDISNRVAVLDAAVAKLQAATDLGGDQATLIHNFQSDISGLQQLGTNIAADITVQQPKPATPKFSPTSVSTRWRCPPPAWWPPTTVLSTPRPALTSAPRSSRPGKPRPIKRRCNAPG